MFGVKGYYPSFFGFLKKCKNIKHQDQNVQRRVFRLLKIAFLLKIYSHQNLKFKLNFDSDLFADYSFFSCSKDEKDAILLIQQST